jgi:hypothetical protein
MQHDGVEWRVQEGPSDCPQGCVGIQPNEIGRRFEHNTGGKCIADAVMSTGVLKRHELIEPKTLLANGKEPYRCADNENGA